MSSAKKDPQLDAKHQAILKNMLRNPENKTCADCKHASPRWASTNLGVFLCISCSGIHRKLGTHISKVRSITLDTWTASQIAHFQTLGNAVAAAHYEASLPSDFRRPSSSDAYAIERFIRDKYERQLYVPGAVSSASVRTPRVPPSHTLGQRPSSYAAPYSQPSEVGYDDYGRHDVPRNTSSYSSQFRNTSPRHQSSRFRASRHSYHAGNSYTSRTGISYQTSAVVSAITDMGFPQYMAEEAAARTDNNLQKAVDWVLKQEGTRLYAAPEPRPKPQLTAPVPDLLDFTADVPGPATFSTSKPVPKTMGLESLMDMGVSAEPPQPARVPKSADDNFADFGAFQSALPAESASPVQPLKAVQPAQPVPQSTGLNSALAGLYAQQATKTSVASPTQAATPNQPTIPQVAVGYTGLRRGSKKPLKNFSLPQTLSPTHEGVSAPKLPTPPPPPIPTQTDMFSTSSDVPPPPTSLPPVEATPRLPVKDIPADQGSKTSPKITNQDTAEDEDPFAFLSMQALSSATKKKNDARDSALAQSASPKSNGTSAHARNEAPTAAFVPVGSTTSGLTFEDLMG